MAIIPKPLRIAVCGRTILLFEYDKYYVPSAVDDCMAICCKSLQMSLFTPVGNKLKVWSLLTGEVDKVYGGITKGDITAFTFNQKRHAMVLGDTTGSIQVFGTKNGHK